MSSNPLIDPSAKVAPPANDLEHWHDEMERLKAAVQQDPSNIDLNRQFSKLLISAGRLDEALECWFRLEELVPQSPKPARMIAKLVITKNRRKLFQPTAASEADLLRTEQESDQLLENATQPPDPQPKPAPGRRAASLPPAPQLTAWQQLERAIEATPADVDLYVQLSDLYLTAGREYDAERLLAKGLTATDEDPRLQSRWEDVALDRAAKKVERAQRRVEVESTPSAHEALAAQRDEYQQLVHRVLGKRCEREPHNTALRVELGSRLRQAGDYDQALKWLLGAVDDPQQKAAAHLELGECFHGAKKFPEALQHFRQAVDFAIDQQQLECKKLALYRAGVLSAEIKLREPAKRYLSQLVELDPTFQDAARRLHDLS